MKHNVIKKILLVIPPNIVLDGNLRRIGEPLGVLSIATYLKTRGLEVLVYDMTLEGYENCKKEGDFIIYGDDLSNLEKRIKTFKPDIVGVSSMFTSKEKFANDVCQKVKSINSNIIVLVGGMPPTISPELYLNSTFVDYVIMNDGEVRTWKLIDNLNNDRSPHENLDGIVYYDKNHKLIKIPSVKLNGYFEVLPYPDRRLIDMEKYFRIGRPYAPFNNGRRTAHVVSSKGCPFNCIFCAAVNFVGQKVHFRPLESIVSEIKELVEKFNVQEIQFMDDNLTVNKKFAVNLFNEIKKFNIKWCTPNGLFFNSLDEELLELMAESGCYQITLAIESASKRMLKNVIGKKVNLDNVKRIVDKGHSLGLSVHGLFVVGIPGETKEELQATLDFPFENNFDSISFSVANAFKGSRLYDLCMENGFKIRDNKSVNYKQTNFVIPKNHPDYTISQDELEILIDETMQKFYDWSKQNFPEIWAIKYKTFVEKNKDSEEKIKHRI